MKKKIKIKAKSILVGKTKKDESHEGNDRPFFVSTFDKNDPHINCQGPVERYDYKKGIHKVILDGLKIDYLLAGHDIVINNLKEITLEKDGKGHLIIKGEQ
ncbi:MAG: hypothetical protein CMH62_00275 [Nanoarchaeota archaeon]|nr:hypothetical protein [Nanoarchaeota archaeon]|tara:strand:+ start:300 stop:602 length:303 start_codon:yes stop_codon:yes gene_type:complete